MSSASPLKPLLRPASRVASSSSSFTITPIAGEDCNSGAGLSGRDQSSPAMGSSSASSSQIQQQPNRADQIVYRFYLKTVAVLVDGRLTHYGGYKSTDKKKDKWFNLCLPETDLHKADLQIYRTVSAYPPLSQSQQQSLPGSNPCSIPPLLVAFILDTSDIPNGQTLIWNKDGGRLRLDPSLIKTNRDGRRPGIVLERWTFTASYPPPSVPSSSQLPPHTAYRIGIIHFRALFALLRLLPAFRLYRRLRRANNGLRLGIKLWGSEGFPNSPEGLQDAWEIMERDLVGLDIALEQMVPGQDKPQSSDPEKYDFAPLDLFGLRYDLSVNYRPDVDFHVEDIESVLSEKFVVDMDEEFFTPTMASHRLQGVHSAAESGGISNSGAIQTTSSPSSIDPTRRPRSISSTTSGGMPFPSPIPQRQPGVAFGSLGAAGGSVSRPSGNRVSSATISNTQGSLGAGKWGALAEGLPFVAATSGGGSGSGSAVKESASPGSVATSGAVAAARRLSAHSLQPFKSSPSASILRSQNPPIVQGQHQLPSARPIGSSRPSSSIGRTSSFLSQSGRSFTHAQMANMYPSSASPPITGALSSHIQQRAGSPIQNQPSPISPSSLTFSKQHFPRGFSGRPAYMTPSSSSPFIPSSLDRESSGGMPSPGPQSGSQMTRHYSSSLSQRRALSGSAGSSGVGTPAGGLQGSGGDGTSLPGSMGTSGGVLGPYGLLRRTSTRESGLRHSLEDPDRRTIPDGDDIQAFLKSLDAWGPPPSLSRSTAGGSAPHRSDLVVPKSISSSISAPSATHSPSPLVVSTTESPESGSLGAIQTSLQRSVEESRLGNPGAAVVGAMRGLSSTVGSGVGNGSGVLGGASRAPLTRAHVDDMLKRMMSSFSVEGNEATLSREPSVPTSRLSQASSPSGQSPTGAPLVSGRLGGGGTSTYGLLSASRPSTGPLSLQRGPSSGLRHSASGGALGDSGDVPRSSSPGAAPTPPIQTSLSPTAPQPLSHHSILAGAPMKNISSSPPTTQRRYQPDQKQGQLELREQYQTARSLPGNSGASLAEDGSVSIRLGVPSPSVPVTIGQHLSPQTTGGTTGFGSFGTAATTASAGTTPSDATGTGFGMGGRRRGPVLVRGGFGAPSISSKTSTSSSSPNHSPIRDFNNRLSARYPSVRPGVGIGGGMVGNGAAHSLGQAVDDDMGWKLGRTRDRDRLSTPATGGGGVGTGSSSSSGGGVAYPLSAGMLPSHSHSSSVGTGSTPSAGGQRGVQGYGGVGGRLGRVGGVGGVGVGMIKGGEGRLSSGAREIASGPSSLGAEMSGDADGEGEEGEVDGEGDKGQYGERQGDDDEEIIKRGRGRAGRVVASEGDEKVFVVGVGHDIEKIEGSGEESRVGVGGSRTDGMSGYGSAGYGNFGEIRGGVGKLARLGLPDES